MVIHLSLLMIFSMMSLRVTEISHAYACFAIKLVRFNLIDMIEPELREFVVCTCRVQFLTKLTDTLQLWHIFSLIDP